MEGAQLFELKFILPEVILAVTALFILMRGAFRKTIEPRHLRHFGFIALFGLALSIVVLVVYHKNGEVGISFEGQLIQDDFVYFAKLLILMGSGAVLALSLSVLLKEHLLSYEYPVLILLSVLGMLLMVGAHDFLTLFVGLEMQGLTLYILAALNRDQLISSEAALKYFILGALATCLFLYGVSLVYGFSGSTGFEAIEAATSIKNPKNLPFGLYLGLVFIIGAFSFKISAVPFHMWTPDVYQGCPMPITAFLAATPKVAAMLIFLRLLFMPFISLYGEWQSLITFLSMASMILGAFAALGQTDLKRLFAYSAIGQMGYALMGLASGTDEGIQGVIVYLTLYLVTIIGVFGCFLGLRGKGSFGVQNIDDLSGISTTHPRMALILAIFMFSLAGIPPLAGFFAKFYVFKAAISAGFFGLVIVGVLTSVVATYYYIKIIKIMYFDEVPESPGTFYGQAVVLSPKMAIILNLCALITLLFFVYPSPLLNMAQRAALVLPG
jgi:NADH-quinone oxidoreductase subunit N